MDFIYLRENDNVSNLLPALSSYISEGFVDHALLDGPKHPLQTMWYNTCSQKARAAGHSWVAFVDVDEFIVVLKGCAPAVQPAFQPAFQPASQPAGQPALSGPARAAEATDATVHGLLWCLTHTRPP